MEANLVMHIAHFQLRLELDQRELDVEIELQFKVRTIELKISPTPQTNRFSWSSLIEFVLFGKRSRNNQIWVSHVEYLPSHSKINNSWLKTYIQYMLLITGTFCWDNYNIEGNVVWQPLFVFSILWWCSSGCSP